MRQRLCLITVPALLAALTWWSAQQTRASREARGADLVALLSLPTVPALHPYVHQTEADRQIAALLHAPLIDIGRDGHIQPILATHWRWLKRVTVWFDKAEACKAAEQKLMAAGTEQFHAWGLEQIEAQDAALLMIFSDPAAARVREVLIAAAARIQPVVILRVEAPARARTARAALLASSASTASIKRLWLDNDDAFEMAAVSTDPDLDRNIQTQIARALQPGTQLTVRVQTRQPTLEEPTLEFTLRTDARWSNGRPVTAEDVRATFDALNASTLPLPDRAGLHVVRGVEAVAANRAHVIFWRHHGPSLCAWLGLPILPAAWLKDHALDADGQVFEKSPPPGAGPCAIEQSSYQSLVLRSAKTGDQEISRLTLVSNFTAFSAQLGYRTHALDLFWPEARIAVDTQRSQPLTERRSPAHHCVQLLLNNQRAPLASSGLRKALVQIIDRQNIASSLDAGASPHASLFAPGLWLSSHPAVRVPDKSAAEQTMTTAGWLRNVNGLATQPDGALVFSLLVPADDPVLAGIAARLSAQWRTLGAQVPVRLAERRAFDKLLATHEFDAALISAPPLRTWDLAAQWHSASELNFAGVNHRQIDLLLEALEREFDPEEAARRSRMLEDIALAEHAIVPLLTLHDRAQVRTGLPGTAAPTGAWTLSDLLLARP